MNSNAVQHVEEAKALTAFLREATENLLNREDFSTDCDLENVRHTPCYTSFFQRIQAKAR